MINSQTIISIRKDKVAELRKLNKDVPNFFKLMMRFNSVSNYPLYLLDNSIFISHSEHQSIVSCYVITPFLGSTFTNIFHKAYTRKDPASDIEWNDRNKIIKNLVMGFKGIFEVENSDKLEIEADFATAKNSYYSVFGLNNDDEFKNLTPEAFDKLLDITEFKHKDKNKEQEVVDSLDEYTHYLGAFAQRQACLAFQSDGLFKAYPFKSNKSINFELPEINDAYVSEAKKLNHRLSFASKEEQQRMIMQYVSSFEFRDELSSRLFESFISGLKGRAVPIKEDE